MEKLIKEFIKQIQNEKNPKNFNKIRETISGQFDSDDLDENLKSTT